MKEKQNVKKVVNKNKKFTKGFTLLELLVVVIIIGILAAIALPQYQKAKYKAKYAIVMPIVKTIGDAMERHYMIHNKYPINFSDIDISLETNNIQSAANHDVAIFDWGFCYFGWASQFVCDLEKEKIAFDYTPVNKRYRCSSFDTNKDSISYKFCKNLPNAVLYKDSDTCYWHYEKKSIPCSSFWFKFK